MLVARRRRGRACCVEPAEVEIEPVELIDATRAYARGQRRRRRAAPGRRRGRPRSAARWRSPPSSPASPSARWRWPSSTPSERQQFGRPIGAYQAVSHRCARDALRRSRRRARSTYYAAWCADAEPESLPLAASMAKARASDAAWDVAAAALQVLGGIGFTWEHDLQFLLKRARVAGRSCWARRASTASGSPSSRCGRARSGLAVRRRS